MKIIWEGQIDPTSKIPGAIYRVLLESKNEAISDAITRAPSGAGGSYSTKIPTFVVEKRGMDSLGGIKWDLESLDSTGYKQAIARAFESLSKADLETTKTGFVKCEYCGGSGYDVYGKSEETEVDDEFLTGLEEAV